MRDTFAQNVNRKNNDVISTLVAAIKGDKKYYLLHLLYAK